MFRPNDAMQRSLSILRPETISPSSTSPSTRGSPSSVTGRRRTNTNNQAKPMNRKNHHNRNNNNNNSNNNNRPPLTKQISPIAQAKLQLLPKIAEFRHKGWITRQEEKEFIEILSEHRSNPFDGTVHSIETLLNDIQQEQLKHIQANNESLDSKQQQMMMTTTTTTTTGTIPVGNFHRVLVDLRVLELFQLSSSSLSSSSFAVVSNLAIHCWLVYV